MRIGYRKLLTLLLLVCLFSAFHLHSAASLQYVATSWDNDSGLPQNSVQAMVQTRDGYLWVGTQFGLARFDGVHFTVYDTNNVPELKGRNISALVESADGSLWIGTFDAGLTRYKDGKFRHYGAVDGMPNEYIKMMCETSDGTVWIATLGGLFRFENETFSSFGSSAEFSGSYTVRTMMEDHLGNLWIGTAVSLVCCLDSRILATYTSKDGLPITSLRGLAEDSQGDIWVGGTGGLARLHDGKFTNYNKKHGLTDNNATALFSDSHGNLWAGGYGGLNRLAGNTFTTEKTPDGMAYDMINVIIEDREGNVWIGAKDGLYRLTLKQFFTYTQQQGLSHNNVISTMQDKSGTIWVGTWGGGLNQFKDGKFKVFSKAGMPTELVLGLMEDRSGNIWFGTDFDAGIFRLRTNQFTHFGHHDGLAAPAVRLAFEESDGTFWVGTSGGLYFCKDGDFKHFTKVPGLAGQVVRDICEGRDNSLWIATDNGLARMKEKKIQNFTTSDGLSSNYIITLYQDRENVLWIGTRGGGLNCYRDGKFSSFTTKDGLFNNDVFSILEDDFGYFWLTCRRGIFRVRKHDLIDYEKGLIPTIMSASFGKADGMASTECHSIAKPSAFKAIDGKLWFATAKGLVMTDPTLGVRANTNVPPIVVEECFVNKRPVEFNHSLLHLPPSHGELEFHYTALSLSAAEKNMFRYKLEGFDTEWNDVGPRRVAYYSNIDPGTYTFRVIGCNNDGVWNTQGASMSFVIEPYFWQRWWFAAAIACFTVFSIGGVARAVTSKRLRRKVERLEQQHAIEKERMRIAKDMHDEIGAKLTKISFLSEVTKRNLNNPLEAAQQIDNVSNSAREVLQALDEIVWAVNPKNDTLDSFATYLCRYVSEFFANTSVLAELEIPSTVPARFLSTEVRHNLVLAIKETLNNVLKHASAENIHVELSLSGAELKIVIKDDGRGFDSVKLTQLNRTERVGNGLANIHHRLEQAGGTSKIESWPGKGTQATFIVQVKE
jgi:ligand-binding sensor domain-containing protein/signal transduction histidine kinase